MMFCIFKIFVVFHKLIDIVHSVSFNILVWLCQLYSTPLMLPNICIFVSHYPSKF